jgi:hypothetical protein
MNISRVNIGFFTGFKKIKQRRISPVLGMTQKGGFSKLCVKIEKRRKHNLVSFLGRIVF